MQSRASTLFLSVIFLAGSLCFGQPAELPRVHLLATGGTIAGGTSGSLNAEDLIKLIPEIASVARFSAEDFTNIGSSRMTPEIQFRLASRVNELMTSQADLAGVVITHGTDSLEETSFFLDLLVRDERPVIFAAAQRPPRMDDSDGPRNLLNAIRLAAAPASRGMGVLITLNDEIHAAREASKTHSIALNAFRSPWVGPVGTVDDGNIFYFRKPLRRLTLDVDAVEPRVDLITLVAGSDGHLLRAAAETGVQGIVLEVFGRGNVPPQAMDAVREVRDKGIVVVFTTRTRGGRVVLGRDARQLGIVSGEDLDGLKARTLLVVALGKTRDLGQLQSYFNRLSGDVSASN
jgi:L-asparaginase